MNSEHGIPVMKKPVDSMEVGVNGNSLAMAAMRRHPIDELQQRQATSKSSFMGTKEEEEVRRLYGSGFAMKLATERRLASQMTVGSIGGGIPSSNNVMGDIISGRDMHIGFEDTLGLPEYRPVMNKTHEDPHMVMERKLGM